MEVICLISILINIVVLALNVYITFKNTFKIDVKKDVSNAGAEEIDIFNEEVFKRIDRKRTEELNKAIESSVDAEGIFEGGKIPTLEDLGYFAGTEVGE